MYWFDYEDRSRNRELLDYAISSIVLSFVFSYSYMIHSRLDLMPAVIIAVISSFTLHELAHRSIARANGIYARYRAWYIGLLLALLITIATQGEFAFAAPGAVVTYTTWYSPEVEASIAQAGPLTNIIMGLVCLALSLLTQGIANQYLRIVGGINALIALFNLLPIPPLDGYKVFRVRIVRWAISFSLSLVLWMIYKFL
ncbi:MAG: M50 family metallopeptidase [Ignisphaera sp.]|nr:M50 family metallopeptidase [Ignisphaera sp.]MCX8167481.1 M50 family metallopeptidase [Ignisphaera sp.]MDW8084655.1 M50 family metallopeptidase [Ignisphaera sp.]